MKCFLCQRRRNSRGYNPYSSERRLDTTGPLRVGDDCAGESPLDPPKSCRVPRKLPQHSPGNVSPGNLRAIPRRTSAEFPGKGIHREFSGKFPGKSPEHSAGSPRKASRKFLGMLPGKLPGDFPGDRRGSSRRIPGESPWRFRIIPRESSAKFAGDPPGNSPRNRRKLPWGNHPVNSPGIAGGSSGNSRRIPGQIAGILPGEFRGGFPGESLENVPGIPRGHVYT
jgi:hypothetical protein